MACSPPATPTLRPVAEGLGEAGRRGQEVTHGAQQPLRTRAAWYCVLEHSELNNVYPGRVLSGEEILKRKRKKEAKFRRLPWGPVEGTRPCVRPPPGDSEQARCTFMVSHSPLPSSLEAAQNPEMCRLLLTHPFSVDVR